MGGVGRRWRAMCVDVLSMGVIDGVVMWQVVGCVCTKFPVTEFADILSRKEVTQLVCRA